MAERGSNYQRSPEQIRAEIVGNMFRILPLPRGCGRETRLMSGVLSRIAASPGLVFELPPIPEKWAIEDVTGYKRKVARDVPNIGQWLNRLGLGDAGLLATEITPEQLIACADFNPALEELLLEGDENEKMLLAYFGGSRGSRTIGDAINYLHRYAGERLFTAELHQEALTLIAEYIPIMLPTEPTEFTTDFTGYGAHYLGKFRGVHRVRVGVMGTIGLVNPFEAIEFGDRQRYLFHLIHELIHQRQAEIFGTETITGVDLNMFDPGDVRISAAKLHDYLNKQFASNPIERQHRSFLSVTLVEGEAMAGELFITRKRIPRPLGRG